MNPCLSVSFICVNPWFLYPVFISDFFAGAIITEPPKIITACYFAVNHSKIGRNRSLFVIRFAFAQKGKWEKALALKIRFDILKGSSQNPFWQEWSFFRLDGENLPSAYNNRHQSVFLPDEKNPHSCFQKRF